MKSIIVLPVVVVSLLWVILTPFLWVPTASAQVCIYFKDHFPWMGAVDLQDDNMGVGGSQGERIETLAALRWVWGGG